MCGLTLAEIIAELKGKFSDWAWEIKKIGDKKYIVGELEDYKLTLYPDKNLHIFLSRQELVGRIFDEVQDLQLPNLIKRIKHLIIEQAKKDSQIDPAQARKLFQSII